MLDLGVFNLLTVIRVSFWMFWLLRFHWREESVPIPVVKRKGCILWWSVASPGRPSRKKIAQLCPSLYGKHLYSITIHRVMTYSNARSCRWTQGGSKMCGTCEFPTFYMSRKNEDMKAALRLVMSLEPVPCLVTTCVINESHFGMESRGMVQWYAWMLSEK